MNDERQLRQQSVEILYTSPTLVERMKFNSPPVSLPAALPAKRMQRGSPLIFNGKHLSNA